MSILRDWSEEGATPEELSLLKASKGEEPSAAARSRTLAALGLGTVAAATTISSTTTAAVATTTVGAGAIAKLGVVLVVAAAAAGGFAWHSRTPVATVHAPTRAAPTAIVASPPETPAVSTAAPSEPDVAANAPSLHPSAGATAKIRAAPEASSDTLSQEVAALEKAHTALAQHRPDAALKALDRYRAQFPNGALSSEETVLRVQAALARGDKTDAAALADKLRAAHPDSPYVRRVEDLVSHDGTDKP